MAHCKVKQDSAAQSGWHPAVYACQHSVVHNELYIEGEIFSSEFGQFINIILCTFIGDKIINTHKRIKLPCGGVSTCFFLTLLCL